jgi:hypothetical protein
MTSRIERWKHGIGRAGPVLVSGVGQLIRHEWDAVRGHHHALLERLAVARDAENLGQMIGEQLDLLPESRLRLRRVSAARRRIFVTTATLLRDAVSR